MRRMKKNLTLGQWLIEKTDGEAYRAGKLHGEKHPEVDQRLIKKSGNLKKLLSQAREMEKDPELKGLIRFDWRDMGNDIRTIHYSVEILSLIHISSDETLKSCMITRDVVKGYELPICEHAAIRCV